MAITKNKILLRDLYSLKDFKRNTPLLHVNKNKNEFTNKYFIYQSWGYEDEYMNGWDWDCDMDRCSVCYYVNCECVDYQYYIERNAFDEEIITCIPAGKEYIRRKKIDSILLTEEEMINTDIHCQLLEIGLIV